MDKTETTILKAAMRAAEAMGFNPETTAEILRLHAVNSMRQLELEEDEKKEQSLMLVRAYKALSALYGSSLSDMANWAQAENKALGRDRLT